MEQTSERRANEKLRLCGMPRILCIRPECTAVISTDDVSSAAVISYESRIDLVTLDWIHQWPEVNARNNMSMLRLQPYHNLTTALLTWIEPRRLC